MKYSRPPAGTSSCQLASYFPTRSALGTTKLLTIESEDPSSPPLIQIHLHHSPPLSSEFSKLTWNSRPKSPSTSLKSLVADFGVNGTTNEFTCSEDHELVVELGCVGKGCRVEYRVEGGEPLVGTLLQISILY